MTHFQKFVINSFIFTLSGDVQLLETSFSYIRKQKSIDFNKVLVN